jgi:UDP-sugar pyrophosphorylase
VLESSGGVVAEFVNPKFSDSTCTAFKKPSRLETLMQDLPKNFTSGEKVGVTVFNRVWCFSACKNNLTDAAQKVAQNAPPESASSAENDFYEAGRVKLRAAGMRVEEGPRQMLRGVPFTSGPRVILRPSFALTLAEVRERIHGGSISGDATLILEGDVRLENVTIPAGSSLVVHSQSGASETLANVTAPATPGFVITPLTDEEMNSDAAPEYLRIRGYRIIKSRVQ